MTLPPLPSDPHLSATVMASAGTGKTWQLVTRLTRLLFRGTPPDAILAITFTRKAAAEMQTRLAERLLALATLEGKQLVDELQRTGIEPTQAAQQRAHALYEELLHAARPLRTTTFHAFCQEILRRFPLEADVPPGFELSEHGGELRRAAWEAMISQATAQPESAVGQALSTLLELCGSQSNVQDALDSFLVHRSDWWAFGSDSTEAVQLATMRLQERLNVAPEPDPRVALFQATSLNDLLEFRDLLLQHSTATNIEQGERFAQVLATTLPLEQRYMALREVFFTKSGSARSRKHSAAQEKSMGIAGEARFLQLHELLCTRLNDVQAVLAAQRTLRMNAAWYRAGQCLLDHYQRIKEEQRLLDFTDLEWRAYQLLTTADNAHWVQYKLDQRIEHLLVDEFQDTNPTQWRLLLPLLQEMSAGGSERQRSVFLVGDGKQSIYRFRRADPQLFHVAHNWLTQHLAGQTFPLHISYRSAAAVIQCVNQVFGTGGPYGQTLDSFSKHDTRHHALWGRVEVMPLVEAKTAEEIERREGLRNPLFEPRVAQIDDRYLREGRQIAARMQKLIQDNTLLGSAEMAHPMHFGDVLILVRKRTHVDAYEQALREAGIPYIGAERGTLLASLEVDDMVRLLETLIAPYNNLALAQILRSPLFACTDDDMIALASAERGSWFERLMSMSAISGSALRRAADCLGRWHALAGTIPIHDLLDRIYSEGNIIARYEAGYPEHLRPRVRANLTRFIELALEIDHGRYPSLTHFLAQLNELRFQDEAPDEAPASGDIQRVRLMTIHAAKGLEAPVVFLADAAAEERDSNRSYQALVDWPAERSRPDHLLLVGKKEHHDPFTARRLEEEGAAQRRESANLLYVAMTRAKQMLIVSGCLPGKGSSQLGWYGSLAQTLAATNGMLESGTRPTHVHAMADRQEPSAPPPPAGLRHPLKPRYLTREIAPSRSSHAYHGQGTDEDGRMRGIAIHRMLERLAQSTSLPAVLASIAAELQRSPDDAEFLQWWQEAKAVHQSPAFRELFDADCYQQAWSEVPVQYQANGTTVFGLIDRLVFREDAIIVVDYKTHRQASDVELGRLGEPYREQMSYYVEGVKRLWPGRTIRPMLLFTAVNRAITLALE